MWKIRHIPSQDIPSMIEQFNIQVKEGNPILEFMRCIYKIDNSNIIYLSTLLDFLDIFPTSTITSLSIGQMIKN